MTKETPLPKPKPKNQRPPDFDPAALISLFALMETKKREFSRAERRVYDVVIEHGVKVQWMTLNEFASFAGVSEPTIVRFCRALELDSFSDFKIRLAQNLACGMKTETNKISLPDEAEFTSLVNQHFSQIQANFDELRSSFNLEQFHVDCEIIAAANRVLIVASGKNTALAKYLQTGCISMCGKFYFFEDADLQQSFKSSCGVGDVILSLESNRCQSQSKSFFEVNNKGAGFVSLDAWLFGANENFNDSAGLDLDQVRLASNSFVRFLLLENFIKLLNASEQN